MKTIRPILSFLLLVVASSQVTFARAAESVAIKGILISASNERGETDRRLAAYEPTLRRILRFESYRFLGEDSAALGVPAQGQLGIGEGQQLQVETERSDGRSIHVRVRWTKGGRTLMNTGLVLSSGVPAVLGGPSTGNKGDVYAVILIGR
jgi:hypothetical protein